jgi:4-hydroxybenzoate polyprenyltransferase
VLRGLALACHLAPTVGVTVLTTALAAAAGRGAAGCVAVAAAVLAGQLSVGWSNDAIDASRDQLTGRRDKPVVRGEISPTTLRVAAPAALVACVPLSLASGWRATLAHLAAVGLAWAYNLGLKATVLSVATYAGAFALLPVFVTLGLPGDPLPRWWAVVAGGLLGAGAHFANTLPDLGDDLATGVRGLPHRLGTRRTARAAAVLLVVAALVLGVAAPRHDTADRVVAVAIPLVTAAVVLAGLYAEHRGRARAAFLGVIAAAGIDVVLLVTKGASFVGGSARIVGG